MGKIQIAQINFAKPDFKNHTLSKEKIVLNWLIRWVKYAVEKSQAAYGDLIPNKADFAKFFNVSIGTVQNAIRQAEDMGYFESKQSIGTMIKNPLSEEKSFEKMFSKKDKAILEIKRYIVENKFKIDSSLPCAKEIARSINTSSNTVRIALEALTREGILDFSTLKGNKACWSYKKQIELKAQEKNLSREVTNTTLIKITSKKMKECIVKNYQQGDKIAPNSEFAKMFGVSIRTVNEAAKQLIEQKIILSRRGRYGTIYLNDPQKVKRKADREEKSLFMSQGRTTALKNSFMYSWEKTLDALKKYIIQNHEAGDKIPSMKELAQILSVSSNTIRRAIGVLCNDGYLIAQRGKYGGVFILEMPEKESGAFTWLALNPSVVKAK